MFYRTWANSNVQHRVVEPEPPEWQHGSQESCFLGSQFTLGKEAPSTLDPNTFLDSTRLLLALSWWPYADSSELDQMHVGL